MHLLTATKRFFKGTLLSRLTGVLRDVSTAYAFGVTAEIAAFMIAFRLVNLPRRLLAEGALQTAFIPEYEAVKQQQPEKAAHLFLDTTLFLTLFLLGASALLSFFGLLALPHLSINNQEIVTLSLLMLPSLLLVSWHGMSQALLQCEGSFFLPSVAPAAFNLFFALSALLLAPLGTEQGSFWLAVAVNFAFFAQLFVTTPLLLKRISREIASWRPHLQLKSVKKLMTPFLLSVGGVAAQQINSAVDPLFARYADPSGPAYLWYAIRIEQLPLALFGISVASALLPALSRAIKQGNEQEARDLLTSGTRLTLLLMVPLTGLIFLFGVEGVRFLFEHGDFSPSDTAATTWCLWGYTLGLIPSTLVILLAPLFYAKGDYRTPMRASLIAVVSNLLLNALFVFGFHRGSTAIAFGTSASVFINFFLLMKNIPASYSCHFAKVAPQAALLLLGGTLLTFPALFFTESWLSMKLLMGDNLPRAPSLLQQGVYLLLYGALFFIGALLPLKIKKPDESRRGRQWKSNLLG